MTVKFYMDHHVPVAISAGLRIRSVDVLTAYEDGWHEADDSALLDRASELGRVLFSRDDDLVVEAVERQRAGVDFAGVIYVHQLKLPVGKVIDELELIAKVARPEDLKGTIHFLPL